MVLTLAQDIQADVDAFKKTQEAERIKQAETRKVQEGVDRAREQNARRKMDKVESREWDLGKDASEPKRGESDGRGRGGRGGRGARGRGRGRAGRVGRGATRWSEAD